MLKADWFELPLERQLTLVKINQEIDECTDIEALRKNLKEVVQQSSRFQHMLSELLREQLTGEVEKMLEGFTIEE